MMFNFIFGFCLALIFQFASVTIGWKQLAKGIDIIKISAEKKSVSSEFQITVVRIDPHLWDLVFMGRSLTDDIFGKTAHEWCESHKLTGAINAGMFDVDNMTHIGYLKYKEHINNSHVNSYKSAIAFDPRNEKDLPPFHIFDLDNTGVTMQTILRDYNSVVQNLRLIKNPGTNVWNQQNREWSEAAIGEDNRGNILFIFSRSPFSMHDLNIVLLGSGIGIVAAQHLEGGPEAQLYLKTDGVEIELSGSFETSYNENNVNVSPWPIPNILGIRPR